MSLITSISGIRGTIGGGCNDGLNPLNISKFVLAYGQWLKNTLNKEKLRVVVGKDGRISGTMVEQIVAGTLISIGIDVVDIGYATTPTTEMAVLFEKADGGIIITASHNPQNWNALKLLNNKGEFIDAHAGNFIVEYSKNLENFSFAEVDKLGNIYYLHNFEDIHIAQIMKLDLVDSRAIANRNFKVVVDCINSVGALAVPKLLEKLGVGDVILLNSNIDGKFAHNPEPLAEHLQDIMQKVVENRADLGIVVDPDVDRLAFIDEKGNMFGEEYTLVAVADYVLMHKKGATVSNLSSSRALRDIARKHNVEYFASAVGELNVVETMKKVGAIIGGEGNGGIIYPDLHYGRDALVGIALFLSHLARLNIPVSRLRSLYPNYEMVKLKKTVDLDKIDDLLNRVVEKYKHLNPITIDGVKIDFDDGWVHLRKSNTEPIVRLYAEAHTQERAMQLAQMVLDFIS